MLLNVKDHAGRRRSFAVRLGSINRWLRYTGLRLFVRTSQTPTTTIRGPRLAQDRGHVMAVELHEITWGHNRESEFYARGHIAPDVFLTTYAQEVGLRDDELPSLVPCVSHLWGRWVPSRGEFDRMLHLSAGPARGAFPFTILETT